MDTVDCVDGSTLTGDVDAVVVITVSIAHDGQTVSIVAAPIPVILN
jgi:hypothetical protein